jgi:hypothetical protein
MFLFGTAPNQEYTTLVITQPYHGTRNTLHAPAHLTINEEDKTRPRLSYLWYKKRKTIELLYTLSTFATPLFTYGNTLAPPRVCLCSFFDTR